MDLNSEHNLNIAINHDACLSNTNHVSVVRGRSVITLWASSSDAPSLLCVQVLGEDLRVLDRPQVMSKVAGEVTYLLVYY